MFPFLSRVSEKEMKIQSKEKESNKKQETPYRATETKKRLSLSRKIERKITKSATYLKEKERNPFSHPNKRGNAFSFQNFFKEKEIPYNSMSLTKLLGYGVSNCISFPVTGCLKQSLKACSPSLSIGETSSLYPYIGSFTTGCCSSRICTLI